MICHEVMCSILYIWFVLNHYSIVCYVQGLYFNAREKSNGT